MPKMSGNNVDKILLTYISSKVDDVVDTECQEYNLVLVRM